MKIFFNRSSVIKELDANLVINVYPNFGVCKCFELGNAHHLFCDNIERMYMKKRT